MTAPQGMLAPVDWRVRPWTAADARHLLWRAQFGASGAEIDRALKAGAAASVERLLHPTPSREFEETSTLLRRCAMDTGSALDLKAWWLHRMHHSSHPLVEKLTLFWHNHFATSITKVRSAAVMAAQNDLCRREALGSFPALLHGMSKDAAMVAWLDGNANRRRHANENFARELLELFALGEGHYTEKDIKEAARAFTGWHVRDDKFWFNRGQHDEGIKTLFGKSGNLDGGDVVNLCLAQPACPRFLAKKLLTAFVLPRPSEAAVAALAERVRELDFTMSRVMSELFSSELFFSREARGSLIKSPVDLVLGALRALDGEPTLPAVQRLLALLGQDVFAPPTVKGWEGGRLWVTSASLLQRANFAAALVGSNQCGTIRFLKSPRLRLDASSAQLTKDLAELLLPQPLDPEQENQLAQHHAATKGTPEDRLRSLLHVMMALPEFQQM